MKSTLKSLQLLGQVLCFSGLCVYLLSSCKTQIFEPEKGPGSVSSGYIEFPLDQPLKPGYSGKFLLAPNPDGSSSGKLELQGLDKEKRYFGKISSTNSSNPNLVLDIADLHEISAQSGKSEMLINRNYQNEFLRYDSLLAEEAIIRILEVNPNGGLPTEVLRGDFGSNLILDGSKNVNILPVMESGISGNFDVKKRKNGRWLLDGSLQGLSGQLSLKIAFYRGNPNGEFRKELDLGQVSADGAGKFRLNFPLSLSSFSDLDTLNGFIGLKDASLPADSFQFKAIANFGGNSPTGNFKIYTLYSPADSSEVASLEFVEYGQAGSPVRLKIQFNPAADYAGKFLSLHRKTWLDPSDTISSMAIPANGKLEVQKVPNGSGGWLRFQDIATWNANARLAEDPTGEGNVSGIADLGGNEVLSSDSLRAQLNESNPGFGINASILFRPRKNGGVISFFTLNNTQSGVENNLLIRLGPKPSNFTDTTLATHRIARINGVNPGQFKGSSNLQEMDGGSGTWSDLLMRKESGAYLEGNFSDGGDFYILCRGNL